MTGLSQSLRMQEILLSHLLQSMVPQPVSMHAVSCISETSSRDPFPYLSDGQRKDTHFRMIFHPPCSNIFMPFVTSVSNITEELSNSGTCVESDSHQRLATPKSYENLPTCPLLSLYEYRA